MIYLNYLNPKEIFIKVLERKKILFVSDKKFLQMKYKSRIGKKLNINNPKTFSEKIQWLKLHDRNPHYTYLVDKYEVKRIVAQKIGEQYLIPLIGVWDNFAQINFDELPNKFVLKCTHDSGGVFLINDKNSVNVSKIGKKIELAMKRNFYLAGREWPYKNIKPRIIAEKYMGNDNEDLLDYKFFCFNGNPKFCQVIADRSTNETIDFYDMEWNHQEFTGLTQGCKNAIKVHPRPIQLNKMILFSKLLSSNMKFVRVDFYEINGELYFGELTFYPASGFGEFYPEKWNNILGQYINLEDI